MWNPFKRKKKDTLLVQFINELGKLETIDANAVDDKIEYDGGTYLTDKAARLLDDKNRPAFIYIKGIPTPLIFNKEKLKGHETIKINAPALKAVLRAKLFGDLLSEGVNKPWDIIMDVLLIVNMILNVIILLQVTGVIGKVINNG